MKPRQMHEQNGTSLSLNLVKDTNQAQILREFRDAIPDITLLRFQWQDHSGVVRACVYLLETAIARVAEGARLKAAATALHITADSQIHPETPHDGIHWLLPDWSSLRPSANPQQAIVMCALEYTRIGRPVTDELCPRQALQRMLGQARDAYDLDFLVGFEVEFLIVKRDAETKKLAPHSRGLGHFAVSGLRDDSFQQVAECIHILRDQGVLFDDFHTEGCRGQYEIALSPLPPMQAIDQLVLVHDTLKNVFSRHGCTVTMSPKPVASDWDVNGQHMHVSLEPARPEIEEHFLAGILGRLPSLCAFWLPQDMSYERMRPYLAGDAVCWGTQCRLAPIRKIKSSHWEFRCIDATANMYAGLAALLAAGLLGIEGKEPLTWPDLGALESEPKVLGDALPRSLDASLHHLDFNSSGLDTMLGRVMVDHYLQMKRYENTRIKEMDLEVVRELFAEIF